MSAVSSRGSLSIVATVYRTGPCLAEFCCRAFAAAKDAGFDEQRTELVLVNDKCPADGLEAALRETEKDERVSVVDLSRNFGHHKAMMTGLMYAQGEHIFLLDSDLEEAPEWLSRFADRLWAEGCDVVYGVQKSRKGGWFERNTGALYYGVFNCLTQVNLPRNLVTARLMTRRYVKALVRHKDRDAVISGLWLITGFEQHAEAVDKLSLSPTSYSLANKLLVMVNSATAFSSRPLFLMVGLGAAITAAAGTVTLWIVFRRVFFSNYLDGWVSTLASIWLIGGLNMLCMGVLGIYVGRIFNEVKHRPYTIVQSVMGRLAREKGRDKH
jgi:putative glycosyltransferase